VIRRRGGGGLKALLLNFHSPVVLLGSKRGGGDKEIVSPIAIFNEGGGWEKGGEFTRQCPLGINFFPKLPVNFFVLSTCTDSLAMSEFFLKAAIVGPLVARHTAKTQGEEKSIFHRGFRMA